MPGAFLGRLEAGSPSWPETNASAALHGFALFGHVHDPEPALADPLLELVAANLRTDGLEGGSLPQHRGSRIDGRLPPFVCAKDVVLGIIARIGIGGAVGHAIEYAGETVRNLGIEGRLTLCNMSIEAGARAGLIAPDETTFAYLQGRPFAPSGEAFERAKAWWRSMASDPDAAYDDEVTIDASSLTPVVTFLPFRMSAAILALTSLDFLGLGVPPGTPSLGEMLAQGKTNIDAWWISMSTFALLVFTLLLLTFMGDALRDALDPRKAES